MKANCSYKIHLGDIVSITNEGCVYLEILEPRDNKFEVVDINVGDACDEGNTDCSCNHFFTLRHLIHDIKYSGLVLEELNLIDIAQNRRVSLTEVG